MISIPVFAIAYLIKGGQFPVHHGKALSAGLVFAFVFNDTHEILTALFMTAAWLLAVAPSMGEEAGAIGRIGYAWGKYINWMPWVRMIEVPKIFATNVSEYPDGHKRYWFQWRAGRSYGILKGVQRGAWMGAVFTVAGATTLSIPIMALGFVAAHFIGQEIYYRIHKNDDWKYSEALVGSLLGLSYLLSF